MLVAAGARNPRIIVDLVGLEYIDCSSLFALGLVRAQARQAGGDLLFAAPRRPVRRLLDLTGLIGVFSVHTSVDEAVLAAGKAAAPSLPRRAGLRRQGMRPGGRSQAAVHDPRLGASACFRA